MDETGFDSMNVIPLVDVMLVLLTIVLTTSTFIATGAISVELPKAGGTVMEVIKTATIEINRQGHLYLDGEALALPALKQSLTGLDRSVPILIRADRDIALQTFVDVMDGVKGLGFTRVSLQTESSP